MTQGQNEKVKQALAIYRGLPDAERMESLGKLRRAKYYQTDFSGRVWPDETRVFAAVVLPYIEQAEKDIQADREKEIARVRADILREAAKNVRVDDVMYGQTDTRRGLTIVGFFAVSAVVVYGFYSILTLITAQMVGVAIAVLAVVLVLSSMGGESRSDTGGNESKSSSSAKAAHTVIFNVNVGDNGSISFEQKAGQA